MSYNRVFAVALLLAAIPVSLLSLPAAEPADVAIDVSKEHIDFLAGKQLVGRYNIADTVAKPYMWPLNGPGGVAITRAFPMVKGQPGESIDHIHHKSLWFCHGDVSAEGIAYKKTPSKDDHIKGVDFWGEQEGHGKIICTKAGKPEISKGHGSITTQNEWRSSDGVKMLDESRTIHLYDLGDAKLLVFDIDLHASVAPIVFCDTKEGCFGIRISDQISESKGTKKKPMKGGGQLENSEGKVGEKDCWGIISPWCDYSGPIDGKKMGVAVLSDPSNPYPSHWMARGYGLLAANPFGREKAQFKGLKGKPEEAKLAKGEHLKLRYGVLIHAGNAKEGKVADYYQQFVKLK